MKQKKLLLVYTLSLLLVVYVRACNKRSAAAHSWVNTLCECAVVFFLIVFASLLLPCSVHVQCCFAVNEMQK